MIAFSTPPAKLAELRDLFVKMDVDDSGTISLQEFKDAMALHKEVPQERVEQMFRDMDIDHSGEVRISCRRSNLPCTRSMHLPGSSR